MENSFRKLETTKMGELAEGIIINEFAKSKGYQAFIPAHDGSHYIDAICTNGFQQFGLDIKCKSSRTYYPDTGCDTADVEKYLTYPFEVYILWLDPKTGEAYGNWLKILNKYKTVDGNCTYFPLKKMKPYRKLTQEEISALKKHENSNYN